MKVLGFTGTRHGMTEAQHAETKRRLVGAEKLHHGDCIGSDEQAHEIAGELGIYRISHPPKDSRLRAFCDAEEVREPKDYLPRDYDIVDESQELIATPSTFHEVLRSGTWTTIRYATQQGKPLTIIFPDGSV
jgi:hypothetical protein